MSVHRTIARAASSRDTESMRDDPSDPSTFRLLVQLAAVATVVVMLLAGAVLAVRAWVTADPDRGICRVSETACEVSPLATIEQYTGVQFPAGTQVIRSAADPGGQGGFGIQSVSAVLRLPRGSAVPALGDAAPASPDDPGWATLRRAGERTSTG